MLSRKTFYVKPSILNFHGFTLLELLVVLAIMALLTGMSAPAISGYLRGARLRGGAQQIASALRRARQLAITKRSDHTVYFNVDNRQFWVERGGVLVGERHTLPDTIKFDYFFPVPPLPPPPPPPPSYNFTARGTGTSGSINIDDPRGNSRRITIIGATGRIRIE